jgi:erythromycin esterase
MSTLNRRTLLTLGATSIVGVPTFKNWAAASSDPLQAWLAAQARLIRTVDPEDQNFSDLEPIAAAIGKARVVQLGEPSHNAGSCFAAKARLVMFLHQRLNFDVVVWESGIYDVGLAEAGLRAGEEPSAAAQRGILRNWSGSVECRPLFAYSQKSHAKARPLVMAGFDSAMTAPFVNLAAELRNFARLAARQPLRRDVTAMAEELIEAFGALTRYVEARDALESALTNTKGAARQDAVTRWERETGAPLRPNRAMLQRFISSQTSLADMLRANERAFAREAGAKQAGFMRRIVDSLGARAVNLYERFGTDFVANTDGGLAEQNRRDACNANNLRWLIEQGYPGRKLIIWAHNAHVMNAYYEAPAWKTVRLTPAANTMKPHGVFLAEWLGRDLYTIGFTAYEGEDGWKDLGASPIPTASESSIEGRLHELGYPYAFVDVRGKRGPLRKPQTMRVPKYDEVEITDASRPYDGVFFISRMARASLIST